MTELGLNIGYQLTPNIQLIGGYTWLYWTHVVRPGTEIDPVLDMNRIPLFSGPRQRQSGRSSRSTSRTSRPGGERGRPAQLVSPAAGS